MVPAMRALVYAVLFTGLAALSSDTACRLGAALGRLAFVLGVRRRVSSDQVRRVLGLQGTTRRRVVERSYAHMGATFFEIWTLGGQHAVTTVANPRWFAHLIAQGRPLVILSGHFGNWDAAAACGARHLQPLFVYAKRQADTHFEDHLSAMRSRLGMSVVYARHGDRRGAVRLLRDLSKGGGLGLMADQLPKPDEGCPGYFGPVSTLLHLGPAVLARRLQAPLVPMICVRVGPGKNRLFIGRPVSLEGEDAAVSQRGMDAMLGAVLRFPSQYFWQHRRFKRAIAELPPRLQQPWRRGLRAMTSP